MFPYMFPSLLSVHLVCDLFHSREIFRVLDLMKADMVNYTIFCLRPLLHRHSVEYERAKFQKILDQTPSE